MGRLDDALRRANLDVSRDTAASPDAPSPWQFEGDEKHDAPARETPTTRSAEARHGSPFPAERETSEPSPVFRPLGAEAQAVRRSLQEDGGTAKAAPLVRPTRGFDPDANIRLVASKSAAPLHVEQFRGLAATLHQAQLQQPLKSIVVTSASPGDGKSHVAVNLALTLCESYKRRVLLIDADLRRPSLHQALGVPNTGGLSEALKSKDEQQVATVPITEGLTLLPAGRPDENPLAALTSDRMGQIIADAGARFDWVIVDAPPVGVLADARLVAESVDAALLVVRAGVTRYPDLEAAADTMGRERILGLVLNAVDEIEIRGEDYYYRHYRHDGSGRG
jgi:protein-tyrosine kinase